jgi:hypothetical protein
MFCSLIFIIKNARPLNTREREREKFEIFENGSLTQYLIISNTLTISCYIHHGSHSITKVQYR